MASGLVFLLGAGSALGLEAGVAGPAAFGASEGLFEYLQRGGGCMWSILACAIVGLVFSAERLLALRRLQHLPVGFEKELLRTIDQRGVEAGLELCWTRRASLARVLHAALLCEPGSTLEQRAALQDENRRLLYDLQRNARWIQAMGVLAPWLGLLGLVWKGLELCDAPGGIAGPAAKSALLPLAFGLGVGVILRLASFLVEGQATDLCREIEERAMDTLVVLERKARRSPGLQADLQENVETQSLSDTKGAAPQLDDQFEESGGERALKSSMPTPVQPPAASGPPADKSAPGQV